MLGLGVVHEFARAKLNGRSFDVLWKPPFRLDVTNALKSGSNVLEVQVCNLWNNRLLGDEQFPDDMGWTGRDQNDGGTLKDWPEWFVKGQPRPEPRRKTFTIWNHGNKKTKLMDSGLLGPVTIRPAEVLPVKLAVGRKTAGPRMRVVSLSTLTALAIAQLAQYQDDEQESLIGLMPD